MASPECAEEWCAEHEAEPESGLICDEPHCAEHGQ